MITRRGLLKAAGALPLAAATAETRLKIVVTGGHPGDPEYGCGGTIARYTDLGHEVAVLYMNRGEKHCPAAADDAGASLRTAEARKACRILKARPVFAPQCDGHAVVDNSRYDEFRQLLEAEKPNAVFTHWPLDQHRDHVALSVLVHDAWLRMGKRFALIYYEVAEDTMMFSPAEYVDISGVEDRRRAACYAHASQTPDHFYPAQVQINKFRGTESGYLQAEAFLRHTQSPSFPLP